MAYLAIARKYRPSCFEEIIGQEHVTQTLRNAITHDRVHHGYLFSGPRGVGKTTAARALARALNCVNGPTPSPCSTCPSCVEISEGRSPDLIEIDGASNNSVEDIRDLRETVRYAPTGGSYKVYLIDEVHMLSTSAFNALLKTLEEPPSHVVFIFATTEPHKIPDTILSRVQRFDFKRISVEKVAKHLGMIAQKEGVQVEERGLKLLARAGEGSMRDSQSLLDQAISYSGQQIDTKSIIECLGLIDRSLLFDMLGALLDGDAAKGLQVIATVHSYGYELSSFTGELLELIRHATFIRLAPEVKGLIDLPESERAELQTLATQSTPEHLGQTFSALLDVHDQVARSQRPRIILEMATARLASTRTLPPIAPLLDRLDALDRRLRQGGAAPNNRRAARSNRSKSEPTSADDDRPRPAAVTKPQARSVKTSPTPTKKTKESAPTSGPLTPKKAIASKAPEPSSEQRWSALCAALKDVRPSGVEAATPTLDNEQLTLRFVRARAMAATQLLINNGTLMPLIHRFYSAKTRVVLVDAIPTGSNEGDLKKTLIAQPAIARIISGLNARVDRVTTLQPEETE